MTRAAAADDTCFFTWRQRQVDQGLGSAPYGRVQASDQREALSAVCEHCYITTGDGAESMLIPEFQWVNTMLSNVKNAICGTYHHISKNHIGRYLAAFSYRFNRRFDLSLMVDEMAKTFSLLRAR